MRSSDRDKLYLGKAGEFRIMSDFLARGYNVAVPEVDVGDDVLVINDGDHGLQRLQVKTSRLDSTGCAQFTVSRVQLATPSAVALWYAFLTRTSDSWFPPLLISREALQGLQEQRSRAASSNASINFRIRFSAGGARAVLSTSLDMSKYINDWIAWPSLSCTST